MSSPAGLPAGSSRAEVGPTWAVRLPHIRNPSGAIYGTLVAAAVLSTEASTRDGTLEIAVVVLATLVVYWCAHGYAHMLPERARHRSAGGRAHAFADLGRALRTEVSIVGGCGTLLVILLVSAALGASTNTAVDLALGFAVLELFAWGVVSAGQAGLRRRSVLAYGIGSAALGMVIVMLKVFLQH